MAARGVRALANLEHALFEQTRQSREKLQECFLVVLAGVQLGGDPLDVLWLGELPYERLLGWKDGDQLAAGLDCCHGESDCVVFDDSVVGDVHKASHDDDVHLLDNRVLWLLAIYDVRCSVRLE